MSPFSEPGGDSPTTALAGELDVRPRVASGEADLEPLLDREWDFLSRICEATDIFLLPGLLPGGGVGCKSRTGEWGCNDCSNFLGGVAEWGLEEGVGAAEAVRVREAGKEGE